MSMDWGLFGTVIMVGGYLVLLQAAFSGIDEYLSKWQITSAMTHVPCKWYRYAKNKHIVYERQKVYRYSFCQHGGVWADVFIITPLVAYLVGKYQFSYFSTFSTVIFIIALAIWVALAVLLYAPAGKNVPEAHAHDGRITEAGWVNVAYATLATWVVAMVYIPGLTTAPVSGRDIIIVSVALSVWAIISVMKFTSQWKFDLSTTAQVVAEIVGIGLLTWYRLR